VFDPFGGSNTTGEAAEILKRRWITFEIIQKYVDEIVLVDEESVKKAINLLWKLEGQLVEGAGATVVAYILEKTKKLKNKNVVAVISGGNINNSLFKEILNKS